MGYIIFHKDYPVIPVELNEGYKFKKLGNIINKERIPVGLDRKGTSMRDIEEWFFGRGIPAKRRELNAILDKTNSKNREELIIKNMGLGLADNYWMKKEDDARKWKEINFFENSFNEEGNDIYMGKYSDNDKYGQSITPNNVSSGNLPKIWIRENGILYMVKGSELQNYQEPFNEKIVSDYLKNLEIDHVEYNLIRYKERPHSKCANMLGKNEELVHSYYVIKTNNKDNRDLWLEHYIKCCKSLGLKGDIRKELDNMIIIDYITANTDRHWSNFGIIRDSDTLQVKKLAPIYDNGAALFAKYATIDIKEANKNLESRSFCKWQSDNMRLVKDFGILLNKNIYSLYGLIEKTFDKDFIEDKRKNEILYESKRRLDAALKRMKGIKNKIDYGKKNYVEKSNKIEKKQNPVIKKKNPDYGYDR